MDINPIFKVVLIALLLKLAVSSDVDIHQKRCEQVVSTWASSSLAKEANEDHLTLRHLLFFLHIPRTGGRTYYHCILRKLYSNNEECPRSYDKLRFDPSKQDCKLLVTHDDSSIIRKFPGEQVSVVTILRNPIDRVLSSYEFAIEVAARFLVHPNLTSATRMSGRIRSKSGSVSTLDIWPWKHLVPWMREDLFSRREARKLNGKGTLKASNPYEMKEIVMPLDDYVKDPVTLDIVHNGATLQIAGLTNNSYSSEAHEVRRCIQTYDDLGEQVLRVAKKKLDSMLYVGLTENHRESASMFAYIVGSQVISQSLASNSSLKITEVGSSGGKFSPDQKADDDNELVDEFNRGNMTVDKLMNSYEDCIASLRKSQAKRRSDSFRRIAPAVFSKQDRLRISESVIEKIKALNNLDMELYKYAVDLSANQTVAKSTNTDYYLSSIYGNFMILIAVFVFLVLIFLNLSAKRRSWKVKL